MATPRRKREAKAEGPQPPQAEAQQETPIPNVEGDPGIEDEGGNEAAALLRLMQIPYFRRALVSSLKERLEIGGAGAAEDREVTLWSESTERSPDRRGHINKEVVSMGLIQESDVGRILQNPALMDEVVKALVEDSDTMDTLADDIADKLQDALEDDSEMRKRLIDTAMASDQFKKKLVTKLVADLS